MYRNFFVPSPVWVGECLSIVLSMYLCSVPFLLKLAEGKAVVYIMRASFVCFYQLRS